MRTPLTSASLANGADVALHGIARLSSNEARTDKRTMASSQFCWLLSPAVRLDSFSSGCATVSPNLVCIMARRRVEPCRTSGFVQVFGCRHDEAIHALRRPASEKRQGTKSREVGHRRCCGAMEI